MTRRATDLAAVLNSVDSAKVTTNLWGERWTKLVINAMNNAVSAVTGLDSRSMIEQKESRRLTIKLGGETIRVGKALGYALEPIQGMTPETILMAAEGDQEALKECEQGMLERLFRFMRSEGD